MNRGVLERAAPVQQQMMAAAAAGVPNWWTVNCPRQPPPPPYHSHPLFGTPDNNNDDDNNNNPSNYYYYDLFSHHCPPTSTAQEEELPHESLSQLLLGGGLVNVGDGEEQKCMASQLFHQGSNNHNNSDDSGQMESHNNWDQDEHRGGSRGVPSDISIKREGVVATAAAAAASAKNHGYAYANRAGAIRGFSRANNMLDFSNNTEINKADERRNPPHPDRHRRSSSECNSAGNGGALNKRARVQLPSSPFKVRKEKLGDRITALHQLVSPFGKTDTASVLLEAIGYIRFLQSQIEALSSPYLGTSAASAACRRHPHPVQGERNCIFPEDPGQLLNDNCTKRKGARQQEYAEEEESRAAKDLRSRGLCLVPVSCTLQVGSDNGADYWAPAALGGPSDR